MQRQTKYRLIVLGLCACALLSGCRTKEERQLEDEISQWAATYEYEEETLSAMTGSQEYNPQEVDPAAETPAEQPRGLDGFDSKIISMATVTQDPDTIWRSSVLDPNDPECLDSYYPETGNPFFSLEGKVYANDRILSIDIPSVYEDEIYTFTFGYITGEYNQFLYLNPRCSIASENRPIGYYATCASGLGTLMCRNEIYECDFPTYGAEQGSGTNDYYIPGQAYDFLANAGYESPVTPGLAYYTDTPLADEYGIVNIRAVDMVNGTTIALIRLYIAKDAETGTYYLHHAENRNVLQTGSSNEISPALLQTAMDATYAYLEESNGIQVTNPDNCNYLAEYLAEGYGRYYFDTVVPLYSEHLSNTMSSYELPLPALAVTINEGIYGKGPYTIYFGVFGNSVQLLAQDLLYPHDTAMCLERLPS